MEARTAITVNAPPDDVSARWRDLESVRSPIENAGTVRFHPAPGGQGTGRGARRPGPQVLNPRDAIVKITSTAVCGSDLHHYDGYIPTMEKGDILGHEFMGESSRSGPVTHRMGLHEAPAAYQTFKHKEDECVKVVLRPGG